MPGFSLEPVLTAELTLGIPMRMGPAASGALTTLVPFTGGKLKSVEGGLLSGLMDAECSNGLDISRLDPSMKFTRLGVDSVWKNKDDSILIMSYDALIGMSPETVAIFMGQPEAKTTEYGNIYATMKFETGDPKLKALQENLFVGSGRFVVAPGSPLTVEYEISRLVHH